MPRRKSATSLKKLCEETFCRDSYTLYTLQQVANHLPKSLVNDLYEKCYGKYYDLFGKEIGLLPPLSADLFLHSKTKQIHFLQYFDQPADEIVGKISQHCKNLREVYLKKYLHMDHIIPIVMNNPHISLIELFLTNCTDYHLSIIGKHCPQLQHLKLKCCDCITDEGIDFLPEKLVILYLPESITINGQVNALDRLPHLKELHTQNEWRYVIERYATLLSDRVGNRTYQIEKMKIDLHRPVIYNNIRTVAALFPKLCNIYMDSNFLHTGSGVGDFLETINHNLVTHLSLHVTADIVKVTAHLCPMLEELDIKVGLGILTIEARYWVKPKHTAFKHLRTLAVWNHNGAMLSMNDFKWLLANCRQLKSLTISRFSQLSEQVIYDLLSANPLECVKFVKLVKCGPFGKQALGMLFKSLNSLERIEVCQCRHFSFDDKVTMRKLIGQMNWAMDLI